MNVSIYTYLACLVFSFLIACKPHSSRVNSSAVNFENVFQVKRVIDGDTFIIYDSIGQPERIRLIGVDAPETRRSAGRDIGIYGEESKTYLTNLLNGQMVRLEYDVGKTDRYRRTLAYVYLLDGTFVNAELVRQGFATIMTVPPNVKFADYFLELEKEARGKNKGLWKLSTENEEVLKKNYNFKPSN